MINQIVKFNVKPEHCAAFKTALLEDKKNAIHGENLPAGGYGAAIPGGSPEPR